MPIHLAIIGLVAYGGVKDYEINVKGPEIVIEAPMYNITFDKDQVISVSVIEQIPIGTRTNGYGGVYKRFGHFSINGYGNCMLYVYNNVDRYVVVQLTGSDPGYIIINDKTIEETEALYQTINQWLPE